MADQISDYIYTPANKKKKTKKDAFFPSRRLTEIYTQISVYLIGWVLYLLMREKLSYIWKGK